MEIATVGRSERSEVGSVAASLARAFFDDPVVTFAWPNDAKRQGKGLGGQVLTPVLDRADAEGVPVWTWSSNQRNLAFYHRYGFEVLDELPFASGGPSIYPIRREPRT